MEYKGYKYDPWKEYEDDNVKIFHDVHTPEGKTVNLDWSPYSHPSTEDFALWIDLGMPKRRGTGPLNQIDLLAIQEEQTGHAVWKRPKSLAKSFLEMLRLV